MGLLEKWTVDRSRKCQREMGTGPQEGGQASERMEWMEEVKGGVVVEPEPLEAAWKLEGVASRQVVVIMVVLVVWVHGVACHEMHGDPLRDVVGLLHASHGPKRSVSL